MIPHLRHKITRKRLDILRIASDLPLRSLISEGLSDNHRPRNLGASGTGGGTLPVTEGCRKWQLQNANLTQKSCR
jgi:hypothetical protein